MSYRMMGIDGREYPFKQEKGELDNDYNKSSLHIRAKKLIKEIFPATYLAEEVSIQINNKQRLYIDIYVPVLQTAIEIHGQQHFCNNKHFYKNNKQFAMARGRDLLKKQWCEINNITLVELLHNETEDEWRTKIRQITR